jgi:hypothetical protein
MALAEVHVPYIEIVDPAHKEKNIGAAGAQYLTWAVTNYPDSRTTQAAYIALHCKTTGYLPLELGKAVTGDIAQVMDTVDRINNRNIIPKVNAFEIRRSANEIFPFAKELLSLDEEQLRGVIKRHPKSVGGRHIAEEAALKRDVRVMMVDAESKLRQSKETSRSPIADLSHQPVLVFSPT